MPTRPKPARTAVPQQFRSGSANTQATTTTMPTDFVPFQTPGFITEPQWKFICDLMDKRDLFKSPGFFDKVNAMDEGEYAAYIADLKEKMKRTTKGKASEVIEALKALPRKPSPKREEDTAPRVPDGRYALEVPSDELNPVHFYKVNTPTKGDYEGFTFVERFASDDVFPVKGKERYRVLEAIAADPLAAAQRFGNEFKRCCVCSKGLTRVLSREMGIGPVCASRVGWVDEAYVEAACERIYSRGEDPTATVKTGIKPLPNRGRW